RQGTGCSADFGPRGCSILTALVGACNSRGSHRIAVQTRQAIPWRKASSSACGEGSNQLWFIVGNEAASAARRQGRLLRSAMPSSPTKPKFGGCMTLESITAETVVLKKPIISDSEKLLPEVLQLVRTMPGGVAGILKQF